MKVIKYWKVQLLQLSQPSSNLSGIINARTLVESLLFEGYSKDKPKINLGSGVNIELFTAPDSLETRIFRDHLVDSVRCFPVCEDDGDKSERVEITIHLEPQVSNCRAVMGGAGAAKAPERHEGDDETDGTQEEQTKPLSREAKIEYIKQAFRKGFSSCFENAASPTLLDDVTLDYVYLSCWIWCRNYHVDDGNKARSSSFEDVVKPVIKWLNENANPHTSVNIDATSAQLLTGEIGIHTEEFIKD
ncbi:MULTISPECIES: hypothetical protein [Klebsiella pneumoniae complex]|uniref:hypothetical protein n=1 Tax=Klebsiella pneumoniae complex TaxID=3390273 RepID=UPI001C2BA3C9|nr:hypothetical protein [Klebsiella quasipneumoniae]MBV0645637.1 hypothetical protein [Klebsiella quasipneumoniae]